MRFYKVFEITTKPKNTKKISEIIEEAYPDEIFFKCDIVNIKIKIEIETDIFQRNLEIDEYEKQIRKKN